MTPSETFDKVCRVLWGNNYIMACSTSLDVRSDTVRNWRKGKSRIPPNVWLELVTRLGEKETELMTIRHAMTKMVVGSPCP